jgi:hypothetical protein
MAREGNLVGSRVSTMHVAYATVRVAAIRRQSLLPMAVRRLTGGNASSSGGSIARSAGRQLHSRWSRRQRAMITHCANAARSSGSLR